MPESYGKRQRSRVKAKKATEREERRLARNQRRADRAASGQDQDWLAEPTDLREADAGRPGRTSPTEPEREDGEPEPGAGTEPEGNA